MAAPIPRMLTRISVRFFTIARLETGLQPNQLLKCRKFHNSLPTLSLQTVHNISRPLSISHRYSAESGQRGHRGQGDKTEVFKKEHEITEEDVQESIKYMDSSDYQKTYGDNPVWSNYRRNFKGQVQPQKTRKTCIRGQIRASNPCPICRDQQLVLHQQNVKLLEQFISEDSWRIFPPLQTGLCQRSHKRLVKAIEAAQLNGRLPFTVPFVKYDYEDYYPDVKDQQEKITSSS